MLVCRWRPACSHRAPNLIWLEASALSLRQGIFGAPAVQAAPYNRLGKDGNPQLLGGLLCEAQLARHLTSSPLRPIALRCGWKSYAADAITSSRLERRLAALQLRMIATSTAFAAMARFVAETDRRVAHFRGAFDAALRPVGRGRFSPPDPFRWGFSHRVEPIDGRPSSEASPDVDAHQARICGYSPGVSAASSRSSTRLPDVDTPVAPFRYLALGYLT